MTGVVNGVNVAVGSSRLALRSISTGLAAEAKPKSNPFDMLEHLDHARQLIDGSVAVWGAQGATTCFVVVDGQLVGMLAVRDTPRSTAKEAVDMLKKRGVTCAMLTGR